jgi:hypothetical protein
MAMGMFTNNQTSTAQNVYSRMRPLLIKDGKLHVAMVNSFSRFANQVFLCDDKYTTQIDTIIALMQRDGFQILDVKINSVQGQGLFKIMEGFHTLITYC